MNYETLRIDIEFQDFRASQLKEMLQSGWKIIDKTAMSERYIYYILCKNTDKDLGKCYGGELLSTKPSQE